MKTRILFVIAALSITSSMAQAAVGKGVNPKAIQPESGKSANECAIAKAAAGKGFPSGQALIMPAAAAAPGKSQESQSSKGNQ